MRTIDRIEAGGQRMELRLWYFERVSQVEIEEREVNTSPRDALKAAERKVYDELCIKIFGMTQ